MRIERTAARARNSMTYCINFRDPRIAAGSVGSTPRLIVRASDVASFGDPKTHHDYRVEIEIGEFMSMVDALASTTSAELRSMIRANLSPRVISLIKLIHLCSE